MSDHEFEKKVQLQMEELKFRPSEAVWMEVERNIRRDKRRRRFLLWIPVAATLLLTGGYLVFSSNRETTQDVLVNNQTPVKTAVPSTSSSQNANGLLKENSTQKTEARSQKSAVGSQEPKTENSQESIVDSRKPTSADQKSVTQIDRQTSQQRIVTNIKNKKNRPEAIDHRVRTGNKSVTNNTTKQVQMPDDNQSFAANNNQQPTNSTQAPVNNNQHQVPGTQHPAPGSEQPATALLPDSTEEETAQLVALNSASPVVNQAAPIERKPKKSGKWQVGVQTSGGKSNISTDRLFGFSSPFSVEKSRVADVAYNNPQLASNMISISPPVNKKPSIIETGNAYSLGAFVQYRVAPRLKVGAGLQYAYYSVKTTVGQKVDNSQSVNVGQQGSFVVDRTYRSASPAINNPYTNRYHFIELPLYVSWQINKARRLPPVSLQSGIAIARLINTNAMHYDGVSGYYFHQNSLFNKTQVGLNAGLEIGLLQKYRFPISIGPSFGYNLTGMISKEVSNSQYLWSGNLRLKMLLKK